MAPKSLVESQHCGTGGLRHASFSRVRDKSARFSSCFKNVKMGVSSCFARRNNEGTSYMLLKGISGSLFAVCMRSLLCRVCLAHTLLPSSCVVVQNGEGCSFVVHQHGHSYRPLMWPPDTLSTAVFVSKRDPFLFVDEATVPLLLHGRYALPYHTHGCNTVPWYLWLRSRLIHL